MAFALNDYSDIQKLKEGGMGRVYIATQKTLDRKVIIKELMSDNTTTEDQTQLSMFENEAKSAAGLDHDNVISIYDFGADNSSFYMSMEYIDGPDLEHMLHWRPFPSEIGLMIVLQALKGLHYAHQKGIVHCDIKPSNILVSKTGRVKVADFGLAHTISQPQSSSTSQSVFFTPAYMPPEQALGIRKLDSRVDIWSVGVLLYRIISGRLPFAGTTVKTIVNLIVNSKEADIQKLVPELPDNIAESIRLCLKKEPQTRLSTIEPIIEYLQNYFFELGIRDTEKVIRDFIVDKQATTVELNKHLFEYHIKLGKRYQTAGVALKSDLHFSTAQKFGVYTPSKPAVDNKKVKASPFIVAILDKTIHFTKDSLSLLTARFPVLQSTSAKLGLLIVGLVCILAFGITTTILKSHKKAQQSQQSVFALEETATAAPETVAKPPQRDSITPPDTQKTVVAEVAKQETIQPEKAQEKTPPSPPPEEKKEKLPVKNLVAASNSQKSTAPISQQKKPEAASSGSLRIRLSPKSAQLYVDGKEISLQEMQTGIRLAPGSHAVAAEATGYQFFKNSVTIESNKEERLAITLLSLDKGDGSVHVYSYPWAEVYIDDAFLGTTPTPKPVTIAEGTHSLTLKREGYKTVTQSIRVTKNEVTRIKIQLDKIE